MRPCATFSSSSRFPKMTAPRGQASPPAGFLPTASRSLHSSHFTIFGVAEYHSNFGTSKGQAIWQYRQPMQPSLLYVTGPAAVFLSAPSMQTEVHAGSTQCMHCCFMKAKTEGL